MYRAMLLILCLSTAIHAAELKTIKIDSVDLYYHIETPTSIESDKLIIYLHGGVSQFQFKNPTVVPVSSLLEGNDFLLQTFTNAGYTVVIPIAYNQYNWLEDKGKSFIKSILLKYKGEFEKIFIAGFSDGGTGSYQLFYQEPELFQGLVVFNGYPQHQNFHLKVDYKKVMNKAVVFFSTEQDKQIPYEYLLMEYRRQCMVNKHTYFLLRDGKHSFSEYGAEDFKDCIEYLSMPQDTAETDTEGKILVYPPIDGLLSGTEKRLYPFRKKIGKKYGMNETEYNRQDYSYKQFKELLESGKLPDISPITLSAKELSESEKLKFEYNEDGVAKTILLNNYLKLKAWQ